jgi:glycine oxidase
VVGASVEEQGFDTTLTAGAVHDLLRDAYELWPGLVELEFSGVTAGLRPATPDNAPAIGMLHDRVVVATGHFRNGVLLAPATAAAVCELVEGRRPDWIGDFDPNRFAAPVDAAR